MVSSFRDALDCAPTPLHKVVEEGRVAGQEDHSHEDDEQQAGHRDQPQRTTLVTLKQRKGHAFLL